ncbi:MAG: VIT domain-containing protein [Deltaproteobacteria bacterium]|nr:VIT domain-containing protein [Deltaproteobacteria bacterium]
MRTVRTRLLVLAALVIGITPLTATAQGILMPTEPGLGPLQIGHQRVTVDIVDGTAVSKVDMTFHNHTNRQLEATFMFPMPQGSALQDFSLWMNGKKTKGEVLEANKARQIYEGIVRRMKDPGLLEYVDHELFRARVFPVPANGDMRIEIAFSQVLKFSDGVYTYEFPLAAGKVSGARASTTMKDFTFTADIKSKTAIKSVYSPTHKIDVRRPDDHSAKLGFEKLRENLDRDVLLYYTVGRGDVGMNLLTHAEKGEPGYFLLMVSPKQEWQKKEVIGKVVTFVVDTSGSMARKKLDSAKKALTYCLERLLPEDRFNIVRFSTDTEQFRRQPVKASDDNVEAARRFVDDFYSSGGTAIHEALTTALQDAPEDGAPHLVVFLTDGEPTVGITDEARLASEIATLNEKKKSRIFAFGVGDELNATLLDRLASESGASVEFARDGKETEVKLSGFYNRIAFPVLSDVAVELDGARAFDIYPRTSPALFKGSQMIVVGRYREPGTHAVSLSGKTGAETKKYDEKLKFPASEPEHEFIARLWAVRKVGYLLEQIRVHGENAELKEEVTRLGKKFGIVTPYTSYLVVEDTPMPTPGPRPFPDRPPRRDFEGRASGGAAPAAAPPPEAFAADEAMAPRRAEREKKAKALSGSSFSTRTGADAIATSGAIKALKEEATLGDAGGTTVRRASGRTFVWKDGAWTDSDWKSGAKILKVAYLSDAYFELLKSQPSLKKALTLGERVRIMIDGKRGVEIAEAGEKDAAKVKAFLK